MIEFLLALTLFLGAHSIPARPALRGRLTDSLGEANYLILYSLASLGLLVWLVSAAVRAPVISLWPSSIGGWHLALTLMLPACWLLAGGLSAPNPFSVTLNRRPFDPDRPGIVGVVSHPVLWGFAVWAGVHLIANGHLAALILFGVFLLFSAAGMKLIDRRKRRMLGEHYELLRPRRRRCSAGQLLATFGGGTLLYLALLVIHPILIGPDPAALWFP